MAQSSKSDSFFIIFVLVLISLFFIELLNVTQRSLIIPWTHFLSWISAYLVGLFDQGAIAYSNILKDSESGFAVSIEPGCNGIEAVIVLIAAIVAFPSSIKAKILGISIGFMAIQSLNIVRIISLFYLGQWNETVFSWAHSYIWQALIMLDVLFVFILWNRAICTDTAKETS